MSYGSAYQSGYVFSVNDSFASFPIGVSIGGKATRLTLVNHSWAEQSPTFIKK